LNDVSSGPSLVSTAERLPDLRAKSIGELRTFGRRYQLIYADPPWFFRTWSNKGRDRSPTYREMTTEGLAAMGVKDLIDINRECALKQCALAMWATWSHLPQALELMKAWGFQYSTALFIWHKLDRNGESRKMKGFTTRSSTEVCLLGRPIRGRLPPILNHGIDQHWESLVGRHSAKPLIFYHLLTDLFGDIARVELFARTPITGWDAMGDEL